MGWLFSSKPLDETAEQQREEVERSVHPLIRKKILSGLDCDEIPGASGEFGKTGTNPIPVNGAYGEVLYLNRLRCDCGTGIFYHRFGSMGVERFSEPIDVFESVCIKGMHWDIFYFDFYHPRRSLKTPKSYSLAAFEKNKIIQRIPIGFGTTEEFVSSFPVGLRRLINQIDIGMGPGTGPAMARAFDRLLQETGAEYKRPANHRERVIEIYTQIRHSQYPFPKE